MGLFIWILIGSLIGWAACLFKKNKSNAQKVEKILAGMSGGVIGGLLTNVFYPPGGIHITFTWQTTITSLIGAIIVLAIYFFFDQKVHY